MTSSTAKHAIRSLILTIALCLGSVPCLSAFVVDTTTGTNRGSTQRQLSLVPNHVTEVITERTGQSVLATRSLQSQQLASVATNASDEAAAPSSGQANGEGSNSNNGNGAVRRKYETFQWTNEQFLKSTKPYNINYRVEGPEDGQPILLIHGFGANVNHFRYQFPALTEAGYRVYAVDLLGFGASDKPGCEPYSIELFVALLEDFLQHQNNPKQWIVAGNSIGGLCSLALAQKMPVRGVVLFNCAGGMTGFRYEDAPLLARPILWFVQNVVLGPTLGGAFFENFKSRENVESILTTQGVYRDLTNVNEDLLEILLGPSDDAGAQQVFLKTFAGPPGPTPESILPTLDVPILALWGGADPWTPYDGGMHPGDSFEQYAKGPFEMVVLDNTGHCPHDERPEQVNSKMLQWMQHL